MIIHNPCFLIVVKRMFVFYVSTYKRLDVLLSCSLGSCCWKDKSFLGGSLSLLLRCMAGWLYLAKHVTLDGIKCQPTCLLVNVACRTSSHVVVYNMGVPFHSLLSPSLVSIITHSLRQTGDDISLCYLRFGDFALTGSRRLT